MAGMVRTFTCKKTFLLSLLCLSVLAIGLAPAQEVGAAPTFYNTGVDNSGTPMSGGSTDTHYTFRSLATFTNSAAVVLSSGNLWIEWPGYPDYASDVTDAKWIYDADTADSGYRGYAIFKTTFDLTGFDPSNTTISGSWAADQYGSIYLNDQDTGISLGNKNWTQLNNFSIASGFITGINRLDFRVNLADGYDGLMVSNAQLTTVPLTSPVPEPATLFLLSTGLMGLLGLSKRVRSCF